MARKEDARIAQKNHEKHIFDKKAPIFSAH
jgi:hypothetical protein